MESCLISVALRNQSVYLPAGTTPKPLPASDRTLSFAAYIARMGYTLSQEALEAVNSLSESDLEKTAKTIDNIYGIGLNWASMIKDWTRPVDITPADHFLTEVANLFPGLQVKGTTLPCGHLIPDGTFPLERYNGCPFCGTPFVTSSDIYTGQQHPTKVLGVMRHCDMKALFHRLLASKTPLDGTMLDSLKTLAAFFIVPADAEISIRETVIAVASVLIPAGRAGEILRYITSANDVLRLIWYSHTGQIRVCTPKVYLKAKARNVGKKRADITKIDQAELNLHFSRPVCREYARLIESLPQTAEEMCETMNSHRGMWVRVIRALRLTELARRMELTKVLKMLDLFYRKDYLVWAAETDAAYNDGNEALLKELLADRPGEFARRLFSCMLTFGAESIADTFSSIADQIQPRLILTLADNATTYFRPYPNRHCVYPRPDLAVMIDGNKRLKNYTAEQLRSFATTVRTLALDALKDYFRKMPHNSGESVYIAPALFEIPYPIDNRSDTIQDTSYSLQGQPFEVKGNNIRLFMQWGKGLPAQHLDMDLSARLFYKDGSKAECAYYQLAIDGATHSGDIINIPDNVGTAEYIELDMRRLSESGAELVVFCCNAYSNGAVAPGVTVGWMDSSNPMSVNDDTGVAYDPSTVEHQVRVPDRALAKGLVFGVLEVECRRIIWLEMPMSGRLALSLSPEALKDVLRRLHSRISIGELLALKAEAWEMKRTDGPKKADRIFSRSADAWDIF